MQATGTSTPSSPGFSEIRDVLRRRADELGQVRLAVAVAPGGSGKTTLFRAWRDAAAADDTATLWLDLTHLHDDFAILMEDLVDNLRLAISGPEFGGELLRELTHLDPEDAPVLARRATRALLELPTTVLCFLDNFHLLDANAPGARVLDLLLRDPRVPLRFAIASRGTRPACTARFLADGQAFEIDSEDLSLRFEQVVSVLAAWGIEPEIAPLLLAETRGWATGVQLAARALGRVPQDERNEFIRTLGRHGDLFDYVANEIITGETPAMVELLERSALTGPVYEPTLDTIASDLGGAKQVEDAVGKGLLIHYGERVGVHHLWDELLQRRLRRSLSPDAWYALNRRTGELVRAADPERALLLWFEAGFAEGVAEILEARGRIWIDAGRTRFVADWLEKLPVERVQASPRLAHLAALTQYRHNTTTAIERLEQIAQRLRRSGDHKEASAALTDAWIFAQNENDQESLQRLLPRLLSLRRLATDPDARTLGGVAVALLAASRNRHALAQRIMQRLRGADRSPLPRGTVIMGLTIIGRYRNPSETLAMLDEVVDDPVYREHAPSHFMFVAIRALLRGLRSTDRGQCLLEASEAAEAFQDFGLTVSEMASRESLGKLLAAEGRREEAFQAFERAATLARRIGHRLYEAATRGHAALELRVLGREAEAEATARRAALLLVEGADERDPISIRFPAMVVWRALAECGSAEEALAAARSSARSFYSPDLPAGTYQTALQMARIAELAGDDVLRASSLGEARQLWDRYGEDAIGPDLDPEILDWAKTAGYGTNAPAVARWDVRSLGGLKVLRSGKRISDHVWRGATTRRLLLRLLAAQGSERREVIQLDLWPDADPRRAAANLRVALSRLRSVLGSEAIHAGGDHISVSTELLTGWDVKRMDDGGALAATQLYRGPFAPEVYDDWAEDARREIEARFLLRATREVEQLLQTDTNAARTVATRLTEVAPLDEETWVLRARTEHACGEHSTARRTLARARAQLERELGSEPGAALQALERELEAS